MTKKYDKIKIGDNMKIKESNKLFAVIIILILVLIGVLLFRSLYISNNSNTNYLPDVTIVNEEELETYILENASVYLYINNSSTAINKRFEKDLNKSKYNTKVVHYDVSKGTEEFFNNFINERQIKIEQIPAFVYIKDNEVMTVFYKNDLTINNVEPFDVMIPKREICVDFQQKVETLYNNRLLKEQENSKLSELQSLLLAKMGNLKQ